MEIEQYDWRERARQKAGSRLADERDIAEGRSSPDDVRVRNGFIPAEVARSAKITDWGY